MSILGMWESRDKREPDRRIYVTRTGASYAYGHQCDARGLRLPGSRETRVRLTRDGKGVQGYRRPGGAA